MSYSTDHFQVVLESFQFDGPGCPLDSRTIRRAFAEQLKHRELEQALFDRPDAKTDRRGSIDENPVSSVFSVCKKPNMMKICIFSLKRSIFLLVASGEWRMASGEWRVVGKVGRPGPGRRDVITDGANESVGGHG